VGTQIAGAALIHGIGSSNAFGLPVLSVVLFCLQRPLSS
jgi:hypothetical protein